MGILNDLVQAQLKIHERRLREAEQKLEQDQYAASAGKEFIQSLKKDIKELKSAINDSL
jgi:hypothetical protein